MQNPIVNRDPGDETDVCPHGIRMYRSRTKVFAGGVFFCRCCRNLYGTFSGGPLSFCDKCRNVLE